MPLARKEAIISAELLEAGIASVQSTTLVTTKNVAGYALVSDESLPADPCGQAAHGTSVQCFGAAVLCLAKLALTLCGSDEAVLHVTGFELTQGVRLLQDISPLR